MAFWHRKFKEHPFNPDPCNTLYPDWDSWWDGVWPSVLDDIFLRIDMKNANMLYARHQPRPMYLPLLPPARGTHPSRPL